MHYSTALSILLFSVLTTAAPLPQAGSIICGTTGWDVIGATPAYYSLINATYSTVTACKKLCTSTSCGSFAVGNGTCNLYKAGVASELNANTASLYAYYDAACPA